MLGPPGLGQLAALLAALALAGCAEPAAEPAEPGERTAPRGSRSTPTATRSWLSGIGKVRLIGVDTPEVYGGVECYGREASAFVERTVPLGSEVSYRLGVDERDRYGRALAYVWLPRRPLPEPAAGGPRIRPAAHGATERGVRGRLRAGGPRAREAGRGRGAGRLRAERCDLRTLH